MCLRKKKCDFYDGCVPRFFFSHWQDRKILLGRISYLQCRRSLLITVFVSKAGFVGHRDKAPREMLTTTNKIIVVAVSG